MVQVTFAAFEIHLAILNVQFKRHFEWGTRFLVETDKFMIMTRVKPTSDFRKSLIGQQQREICVILPP